MFQQDQSKLTAACSIFDVHNLLNVSLNDKMILLHSERKKKRKLKFSKNDTYMNDTDHMTKKGIFKRLIR